MEKPRAGLNSLFAGGQARDTKEAFANKVGKKGPKKEKFTTNAHLLAPPTQVMDKSKKIKKTGGREITKEQVDAKLKSRRMAIPAGKFNR